MYTLEQIQNLLNKPVLVFAPEYDSVSQWNSHLVTFKCLSPTQPEIVRTSGGPLQYTRHGLVLVNMSTDWTPTDPE